MKKTFLRIVLLNVELREIILKKNIFKAIKFGLRTPLCAWRVKFMTISSFGINSGRKNTH